MQLVSFTMHWVFTLLLTRCTMWNGWTTRGREREGERKISNMGNVGTLTGRYILCPVCYAALRKLWGDIKGREIRQEKIKWDRGIKRGANTYAHARTQTLQCHSRSALVRWSFSSAFVGFWCEARTLWNWKIDCSKSGWPSRRADSPERKRARELYRGQWRIVCAVVLLAVAMVPGNAICS